MKRSQLTPIALGLAWMVSLAFVFLLGILSAFAFHLKPGVDATAGLAVEEQEAGALFAQLMDEPLDWGRLRSYSPADRVPPQTRRLCDRLAELPRAAERQVLTTRFFRLLPPSKLEGLLELQLGEVAADPARREVVAGLFLAWRERDPAGAEDFGRALLGSGGPDLPAWAGELDGPRQ
jgi:hypothetical protein